METLDQLRARLPAAFPGAEITVVNNPAPSAQHSLLLSAAHARDIALFLRDDPALKLDFCSNVTGVDWPVDGGFTCLGPDQGRSPREWFARSTMTDVGSAIPDGRAGR